MKILSLLAGLLLYASAGFSQSPLYLENHTACSLHVQLYAHDPGAGCSFTTAINYIVPPSTSVMASIGGGNEFVYAEVVQYPFGTGCGFGQALDTDGHPACVTCPGYGAPSAAKVVTGGCNGCPNVIKMIWTAYCGSGPGHIHFL